MIVNKSHMIVRRSNIGGSVLARSIPCLPSPQNVSLEGGYIESERVSAEVELDGAVAVQSHARIERILISDDRVRVGGLVTAGESTSNSKWAK